MTEHAGRSAGAADESVRATNRLNSRYFDVARALMPAASTLLSTFSLRNAGNGAMRSAPDPHGLLKGAGKAMRHIRFESPADARRPHLRDYIRSAIELVGAAPASK